MPTLALVSTEVLARDVLGVNIETVRRLVRDEKITVIKVGTAWRFDPARVIADLERTPSNTTAVSAAPDFDALPVRTSRKKTTNARRP